MKWGIAVNTSNLAVGDWWRWASIWDRVSTRRMGIDINRSTSTTDISSRVESWRSAKCWQSGERNQLTSSSDRNISIDSEVYVRTTAFKSTVAEVKAGGYVIWDQYMWEFVHVGYRPIYRQFRSDLGAQRLCWAKFLMSAARSKK